MTKQWLVVSWAVASLAYWSMQSAIAADGGSRGFGKPPQPSPEAIEACDGLREGAACSFVHREHQISGICRAGPQGEPAACVPDRPRHGAFAPPPEALQACTGLEDGATCSFTRNGNQISGTCRAGREGKPAACVPSRPASQP